MQEGELKMNVGPCGKNSDVLKKIDVISDIIASCRKSADMLEDKLAYILPPPMPQEKMVKEKEKELYACGLSETLSSLVSEIVEINDKLSSIINRLQI